MATNDEDGPTYTAEQVSQGETVLRTPLRKAIFIGGLAAMVVLAIVFGWATHG